jgi:3-oxoacyl-[acyl-carrier-protein] synthase-1
LSLPSVSHLSRKARSRNNQLALAALAQIRPAINSAIERYGNERIGIVIGTSTSGIFEGEAALRQYTINGSLPAHFHYGQQELGSSAAVLARELGIRGPAYVHSSACASSAKALAGAARLIRMDACDAVVAGGVDSLCAFTIAGFAALESVSATRCNPLSRNRNGINIGEGAALFLMSREPATVALRGWGESADGHHMSAPDPSGTGARLAIERALSRAQISAQDLDYINLHGTGTVQNDATEARVIHGLFGDEVFISSTKPLTGHALGAAGAIEAGLCWLAMQDNNPAGKLPPHLWDGIADPALPVLKVAEAGNGLGRPLRFVLSNSFAFGGANAALVLGRE